MELSNVPEAYKKLTNRTLETSKLYNKLQKNSKRLITYQEFCLLVADNFTTDGYDIYMADGRAHFYEYFWTCTFLKTQYFIKSFIVDPLFNALGICTIWLTIFVQSNHRLTFFFLVFKSVHLVLYDYILIHLWFYFQFFCHWIAIVNQPIRPKNTLF